MDFGNHGDALLLCPSFVAVVHAHRSRCEATGERTWDCNEDADPADGLMQVVNVDPMRNLSHKDNRDGEHEVSEESVHVVHQVPMLLGVALCNEQEQADYVPGAPHPPAVLLISRHPEQLALVEASSFSLACSFEGQRPDTARVMPSESGRTLVCPAHSDGLVKREHKVFKGVSSVEFAACQECHLAGDRVVYRRTFLLNIRLLVDAGSRVVGARAIEISSGANSVVYRPRDHVCVRHAPAEADGKPRVIRHDCFE
mmetsp:Transcript_31372/g.38911  ORF Transcript_31372/g.38911 Transcript_31372/m.38911 type:complete len:256 (-) Transcript_31372:92-859(-)